MKFWTNKKPGFTQCMYKAASLHKFAFEIKACEIDVWVLKLEKKKLFFKHRHFYPPEMTQNRVG